MNSVSTIKHVRSIAFIACILMTVGYVSEAVAESRSCDAKLYIKNQKTNGTVTLEVFSAKGNCGSSVLNRCRERAKDAALKCVKIHWDKRWDRVRPEHCEPGAKVFDYSIVDLKQRIESKACSVGWGKSGDVTIDLIATTSGKNKCGASTVIHNYVMKGSMC